MKFISQAHSTVKNESAIVFFFFENRPNANNEIVKNGECEETMRSREEKKEVKPAKEEKISFVQMNEKNFTNLDSALMKL